MTSLIYILIQVSNSGTIRQVATSSVALTVILELKQSVHSRFSNRVDNINTIELMKYTYFFIMMQFTRYRKFNSHYRVEEFCFKSRFSNCVDNSNTIQLMK